MSVGKVFFDTNILLYMYGGSDLKKRALAAQLFYRYTASDDLLVSTQVVQEFYSAGGRKVGMPRGELQKITQKLLDLPLITVGPSEILAAIDIEQRYQISFWDALILAAAESGGADVLYTEGLNHGQQYGTVTVHNPFRA
jgi:predicted nucleic acid-binding protein